MGKYGYSHNTDGEPVLRVLTYASGGGMGKYGYSYSVEVEFWTRSQDGDDWVTGTHLFSFDNVSDAINKAQSPFKNEKGLIESRVYDVRDSRDLIWKKDWHENKIVDYTTIPDFDYHNREYDKEM